MNIHERIQEYRKKAGMSQEQLAEEIKVSRQAISKWEQGTAVPTLDNCMELCRVFNIDMDELCGSDTKKKTGKRKNIFNICMMVLILLSLSLNAVVLIGKNSLDNRLKGLERNLEEVRILAQNRGTQIIYSNEKEEDNELSSFEVIGTLNQDSVELKALLRLKKQTENTQVGCSFKAGDNVYPSSVTLSEDYSYQAVSSIPLIESVNIECYKVEEDEITHLITTEHVIKERYTKEISVFLDEGNLNLDTKRLVLGISPRNDYGAFNTLNDGERLTKMEFKAVLKEGDTIISEWSHPEIREESTYLGDGVEEISSFDGLTVFAYLELDKEKVSKIKNLDKVAVQITITLNDKETVEKEILLSQIKY